MPKIVDVDARRREICRAARQVFARRGVTGTGLAHVAESAGMGRSSLYHYYTDKTSLVRDVVQDLLLEEEALFVAALEAEGPALARLEGLAASLPRLFDAWASVGRLLAELRSRDARMFRPFFRRIRAALAALVAEGQRAGEIDASLDPELSAALVIGAVDGLLLQYALDRAAFPDTDALRDALVAHVRRLLVP